MIRYECWFQIAKENLFSLLREIGAFRRSIHWKCVQIILNAYFSSIFSPKTSNCFRINDNRHENENRLSYSSRSSTPLKIRYSALITQPKRSTEPSRFHQSCAPLGAYEQTLDKDRSLAQIFPSFPRALSIRPGAQKWTDLRFFTTCRCRRLGCECPFGPSEVLLLLMSVIIFRTGCTVCTSEKHITLQEPLFVVFIRNCRIGAIIAACAFPRL